VYRKAQSKKEPALIDGQDPEFLQWLFILVLRLGTCSLMVHQYGSMINETT
jgi:hypothetical protein